MTQRKKALTPRLLRGHLEKAITLRVSIETFGWPYLLTLRFSPGENFSVCHFCKFSLEIECCKDFPHLCTRINTRLVKPLEMTRVNCLC